MLSDAFDGACRDFARESETELSKVRGRIEQQLCAAQWTLRRLTDKEMGWLYGADRAHWPAVRADYHSATDDITVLKARLATPPKPHEIDAMQPALDMLQLLPHISDRKLVSAVAWHFDGELGSKIYWDEVRPWLKGRLARSHPRTLKRHYDRSVDWLAALVVNTQ